MAATALYVQEELKSFSQKWYFTREEMEHYSPSRKDGIDHKSESRLRMSYCSFLQELGVELKVPQVTIATSMMLCHRFYMRQSHAKNHWQTIATACMFLACKAEETPRRLIDLVVVAYKLMYKWDPSSPQRIRQKEVCDKEKELVLTGEKLILVTVAFDLNIDHPYKPLVAAIRQLEISDKELVKVSWNFVNDWLRTTICLQYKPHYVAAGSLFLAAKFQKVKLPMVKGKVWWMLFDVSPKQLEEVIQQMLRLLEQNQKQTLPSMPTRKAELTTSIGKATLSSAQSCISSVSAITQDTSNKVLVEAGVCSSSLVSECKQKQSSSGLQSFEETAYCDSSDCGSANSIVEDTHGEAIIGEFNQKSSCKIISVEDRCRKIDVNRIRETIKRRKLDRDMNKKLMDAKDNELDCEAWIERELENGVEAVSAFQEVEIAL